MTQPYGQQPYGQQQPGGYPQAPGYAQGMGGMPQAPQEYSQGPVARPGTVTGAAVLAYIQAGITSITTILVIAGLASGNAEGGQAALGWLVGLVQVAGVVLLIMGGVQLMGGKGRNLLVVGAAVELVICVYYLISFAVVETGNIDLLESAKGVLIAIAVFFAIMPTISLVLAMGSGTTQFLQSRRGH